ncbi:hypothetical protein D3C87_1085170 [compost metagenome]
MMVSVANHRYIIGNRHDGFIILRLKNPASILFTCLDFPPETNLHLLVCPSYFPLIPLLQPVVRQFNLIAINDLLFKKTIFIADSAAMTSILKRCERIHKAGGQAAKASISKSGIRFLFFDVLKIPSQFLKSCAHDIQNSEIQQVIAEQTAN